MQEAFLQYLWKHKKFKTTNLKTTSGEDIIIVNNGQSNLNAGPDFFNAQIRIGSQLWAGNIEVHVKASDWYVHNHEQDKNYDNVILHIVWEDNTEIFRKNNTAIPALELKHYVNVEVLNNYEKLFSKKQLWINCENQLTDIDDFIFDNWIERVFIERLEQKTEAIQKLLKHSKNDWEAVLFKTLAKAFGGNVNGEAFLSLANSFDFSIVRKLQHNTVDLEALFFGQSQLLPVVSTNLYTKTLTENYTFLKQKFLLQPSTIEPLFFRLRPQNFPTIRLSQLANLYTGKQALFFNLINATTTEDMHTILSAKVSVFWQLHYTFQKSSKKTLKKLTKSFIDILIINAIIPLKFCYTKAIGKPENSTIISLTQSLKAEQNNLVNTFKTLRKMPNTAVVSQGLIQLKKMYCDTNKCLHCAVGNTLISTNG